MAQETNQETLLRIEDGQTREQAIEAWWQRNGLDHIKARDGRRISYAIQKLEALETMRERSK